MKNNSIKKSTNRENATIEDAINYFHEPDNERLAEKIEANKKDLEKNIKIKQTALLIDLIKSKDVSAIKNYLDFLAATPSLENLIDYNFSDNFLIVALQINDPTIIDLLLNFLLRNFDEHHRIHVIVLFSLAYVSKNNFENNVHLKLQHYLDKHNAIDNIINSYGLLVLFIAAQSNENLEQPGFIVLEKLFITYYRHMHARNKTNLERPMGTIPIIFNYAVLNCHFELAKFLLAKTKVSDKSILLDRCTDNVSLIHQCFEQNKESAIEFLIQQGVDLCSLRKCKYEIRIQGNIINECDYLTVLELSILKHNYKRLTSILKNAIAAITQRKFSDLDVFLQHLVDIYNKYASIKVMNIFHEFDLTIILCQEEIPAKSKIKSEMGDFYDIIFQWLHKYYADKNKYKLIRETQLPHFSSRLAELTVLLNILNRFVSQPYSSSWYRYLRFRDDINRLPEHEKKCIEYAITRLEALGHLIENRNISYLYKRFQEIEKLFIVDKSILENYQSIRREYDTDDLAMSLLLPSQAKIDLATEMSDMRSSYLTPLLLN